MSAVAVAGILFALGSAVGERVVLAAGDSRAIDIPTVPGTAYVLTVLEHGIDCEATLSYGDRRLRGFDGDALRFGSFRFAFLATQTSARIDLSATRRGSPPGTLEWRLEGIALDNDRSASEFALDLLETEVADRFRDPTRARTDETMNIGRQLVQSRAARADDTGFVRASLLLDRILAGAARRPEAIEVLSNAIPVMAKLGDHRASAGAYNNIGMHRFRLGDGRLAQPPLRRALEFARLLRDELLEAVVQNNLCLTTASRGSMAESIRCYRRAMSLSLPSGDSLRIATAHNNLGNALSSANRHEEASAEFERAIALRNSAGDTAGAGDPLGNLGLERQAQARYDEAEILFRRSEAAYRGAGDRDGLSTALRHRGQLRLLLGDPAGAVELLTECVALDRASGRRRDLITALTRLGDAQSLSSPEIVPTALTEAIALAEIDAEPRTLADALMRFARAANRAALPVDALAAATKAEAIARSIEDSWLQGLSTLELARAALRQGDASRALGQAKLARWKLSAAHSAVGAAEATGIVGMAEVRLGLVEKGIATLASATVALEKARESVAAPESRARFFGVRRSMHEAHVLALVELAQARLDPRLIATALAVSDAHRSRVLFEVLAQGGTSSDEFGKLDWPSDVALLHFLVTPEASVALVKRGSNVHAVSLPGGATLQAGISSFLDAILNSGNDDGLCAMLWKPLAALDLPERVVVVPDGPLHGLPWAALPCLDTTGRRLIDRHEFATLPSVAVWRARFATRPDSRDAPIDTLVIADPVYRSDDARFVTVTSAPASPDAKNHMRGRNLLRLPWTLEEARLIARLHKPDGLRVLAGFDATRDAVMSHWKQVRNTLHFGTHGTAGTRSLGEAGLVLSQFYPDGQARDGFLGASDIAKQRLRVDLVVLAACDSAGGVVVSGESALGVSYAFTMAGARNVIGAVWPVSDVATYALMEAFYTSYYRDHLDVSAALRHAQQTLQASSRFRDPRHWAAFQLSEGARR